MDRLPPARAATRTLAQHRDARDLRGVIVDALAAQPINEQMLRDGVWCVEAYFGQLGGVAVGRLRDDSDDAPVDETTRAGQ